VRLVWEWFFTMVVLIFRSWRASSTWLWKVRLVYPVNSCWLVGKWTTRRLSCKCKIRTSSARPKISCHS
jgi:hypothetical protein